LEGAGTVANRNIFEKTFQNIFFMETVKGIRTFNPANRSEWRKWLAANHTSAEPVCVVIFHKKSKTPNITYGEAVEEALCFGWIDNKGMKRDDESMYLQFCPRKENSNWSKLNRDRAEKLKRDGLMTEAGQVFIDIAKKSGKWNIFTETDSIPPDLLKILSKKRKAFENFRNFPPSSRRMIIQWIISAKKPETRQLRIEQTVALAAQNIRAKP
jgi:uncharacterized protein YdeI (YjbR/CyaY-like superfamily)